MIVSIADLGSCCRVCMDSKNNDREVSICEFRMHRRTEGKTTPFLFGSRVDPEATTTGLQSCHSSLYLHASNVVVLKACIIGFGTLDNVHSVPTM